MPISTRIKNHLEETHVPYLPLTHPSSYTAQGAAAGAGVKKENSEHGDMQVASLKMVSSSCK
jgi:hypothetical protein